MATRKLKQEATSTAGTAVTTCPRPDCPNPTLHIAKSGSKYRCIGCWRKFTSSLQIRAVQQKSLPKCRLREFSPARVNGLPKLADVKRTIRLRLRPARSGPLTPPPVSIATEHTDSLPAASIGSEKHDSCAVISVWAMSSEEEDDDVSSTARYDGATAAALLSNSSTAAGPSNRSTSPSIATPVIEDISDVDFPHFNSSLPMTTVRDEDCESTGSSLDEVIPVGSSIVRALKLTHSGRKFTVCCGRSTGIRTGVMMRVGQIN